VSETQIIVNGEIFSVEAIVFNQKLPAIEFLETLPELEQIKLAALFKKLADTGKIWNIQNSRI